MAKHLIADIHYGPGNSPSWLVCGTDGTRLDAPTPDALGDLFRAHGGYVNHGPPGTSLGPVQPNHRRVFTVGTPRAPRQPRVRAERPPRVRAERPPREPKPRREPVYTRRDENGRRLCPYEGCPKVRQTAVNGRHGYCREHVRVLGLA